MRYAWPSTIWRRQFTSGNQCPDLICAAAASNLFSNFQMSRTPMNYSIGITPARDHVLSFMPSLLKRLPSM